MARSTRRGGNPMRGEGFDTLNSPLTQAPLPRDVVPPVSNPSFPARDPMDLMRTGQNRQPVKGGKR